MLECQPPISDLQSPIAVTDRDETIPVVSSPGSVALEVLDRESRAALSRDLPRWTADNYADYLQSAGWRKHRNEALDRARWQCVRCPERKGLQVHHKSYLRLGHELPEDLEVLCRNCHEGEHRNRDQHRHAGVYFTLVRDVLTAERFTHVADLCEAVRAKCRDSKVPYDREAVNAVISALDARGRGVIDAPLPRVLVVRSTPEQRPVGREEATDVLRRLNITVGFREMPRHAVLEQGAIDAFKRENGLWR